MARRSVRVIWGEETSVFQGPVFVASWIVTTLETENVDKFRADVGSTWRLTICWDNWEWFAKLECGSNVSFLLLDVSHNLWYVAPTMGYCACANTKGESLVTSTAATRDKACRSRHWGHQCRPFGEAEGWRTQCCLSSLQSSHTSCATWTSHTTQIAP